jgi:biopolymer transport protein ExbD
MTAMIDIVFQLLVFFVMTFKVVAMEGDFNIKMPLAATDGQSVDDILPDLIQISLAGDEAGNLATITVDDGSGAQAIEGPFFGTVQKDGKAEVVPNDKAFASLTSYIERELAGESDPDAPVETEVEFDIAYGVKYLYTVKAIEAVSGRKQADGSVKKLIEKIKFRDRSGG